MKIHDVIRTRRQALGLTQEGLAEKLGVSAPAVNKWERSLNYPDITLLPSLARTLGVDLNTLLSFQKDISREETGQFLNELAETAHAAGSGAAFQLARDKLREFPNSDLLAYQAACVLQGVLAMYPEDSEEEQAARTAEVDALFRRSAQSSDPQIREGASYMLATRSIQEDRLDQAESLLENLPDTHREKRLLTASLRCRQGRMEEGWTLLEQELLNRAQDIQLVLSRMLALAVREDRQRAEALSETARKVGELLGLPRTSVLSGPFQLAMAKEDGPAALALLDEMLDSLTRPWETQAAPLYRRLPVKEGGTGTLVPHLLDQLERDPESQFLRDAPGYRELLEKYRDHPSAGKAPPRETGANK